MLTAAEKHFKVLLARFPAIDSDFGADDALTDEATERAAAWAWKQLSEPEREEVGRRMLLEDIIPEALEGMVADGEMSRRVGEDGKVYYRLREEN